MLLEKKRTVYLKELSTAFNRSEEKRKSEAAKTQAEESVNPQKKKKLKELRLHAAPELL